MKNTIISIAVGAAVAAGAFIAFGGEDLTDKEYQDAAPTISKYIDKATVVAAAQEDPPPEPVKPELTKTKIQALYQEFLVVKGKVNEVEE